MKDQLSHTTPDAARIATGFRRGLHSYDAHATAQADIAAQLARLLSRHCPTRIGGAFEFGCGTGGLTHLLRNRFEIAQLWLNDLLPECANVALDGDAFLAGPVDKVALPKGLDLIASCSTVQWLPDLPATLSRLTRALNPGGMLALSGFGTAQFHELRALGSGGAAPGYLNADDWPAILPPDMQLLHASQRPTRLWFNSGMDVLRHLRSTGVNGAAGRVWSRRRLAAFDTAYRARFETAQGLPLTYDPVWIIAQKR